MKHQEFLPFHDATVNTTLIYPQNYNKIKKKIHRLFLPARRLFLLFSSFYISAKSKS